MEYKEVSRYASEVYISHECGVGFGNNLFGASSMTQLLTVYLTSELSDWERMIRFTAQVLMYTTFTKDRVLTIAKNLLSDLVDLKREGESVLSFVTTRVCLNADAASKAGANDLAISPFRQEAFLRRLIATCKVYYLF